MQMNQGSHGGVFLIMVSSIKPYNKLLCQIDVLIPDKFLNILKILHFEVVKIFEEIFNNF